jgi:hypothetical protein
MEQSGVESSKRQKISLKKEGKTEEIDEQAKLRTGKTVIRKEISKARIKNSWPLSASELYRPSDHRLLAKLVPTFAGRGHLMVSATDPHGRILVF